MIKVTDDNIKEIVRQRIKENPYADLNDLDVSMVTDMCQLFQGCYFKGDIRHWNTSNVIDMSEMFSCCGWFNGDIQGWDTKKVLDMSWMFDGNRYFNQDISSWIINDKCDYLLMFADSIYDKSLPKRMDTRIAFGKDYNKRFKQKIYEIIKAL